MVRGSQCPQRVLPLGIPDWPGLCQRRGGQCLPRTASSAKTVFVNTHSRSLGNRTTAAPLSPLGAHGPGPGNQESLLGMEGGCGWDLRDH